MADRTPSVRMGELLGVLSLVGDLGMGYPMEHAFRQTSAALRVAEALGLCDADREPIACGGLLAWVGCHVDAYEQAKWFGDEAAAKAEYQKVDAKNAAADLRYLVRQVGEGLSPLDRGRAVVALLSDLKEVERTLRTHGQAIDSLADHLGMSDAVRTTIEHNFERWDGRGPLGIRGADIELTSRVIMLADVAVAFHGWAGVDAAVDVARQRSGTQFDPVVAEAFCDLAPSIFHDIEGLDGWLGLIDSESSLARELSDVELDSALEAIADFVDVKSPFTLGHSRAVADLATEAATDAGVTDQRSLRRAALLHDLGRLGVSNRVWDKAGPLSTTELERVQLHPYLTGRSLRWAPGLAPYGAIAVQHHERLDGSGYPSGLRGPNISRPARFLAAADTYRTKLEPRPHRSRATPDEAAAHLNAEVTAGRLDGHAVAAVLKATGHRVTRKRDTSGLTAREIEVLNLLVRGHSTREIAAALWITRKTASTHLEHIYTKLGVNNRALASLRAVQLGLVE